MEVVLVHLILPERILIYSFGVGQGLTAGISLWLGLRAWGNLICMWEAVAVTGARGPRGVAKCQQDTVTC